MNFATQCKLLGNEDTSIIGAIGKDEFGKRIEDHLDRIAIPSSRLYQIDAPTASNKIFIDQHGDRYFKEDSWNGGAFNQFRLSEDDWESLKGCHIVAMPAGDPNLEELLKRRNPNQLVVIDFLDYLGIDFIRQHIQAIDIAFLSGRESMLKDLQELSAQTETLIVPTLGANGSIAFLKGQRHFQEAVVVDNIVDTTGCGDAFQAAFSIEWVKTKEIEQSLYAGALAASKVLGFVGGVSQE